MMPKMTGILLCYQTRDEMMEVYERLKALNLPEVFIEKAYNQQDVPYRWTIGIICKDKKKLGEVDKYLVENKIDTGEADTYGGELRIRQFFEMVLLGKYEPGFIKIKEGYCPINATHPGACMFCMVGHILECHHPMTCEEAKCSHLAKYMEEY
jgi:hypothetical protein